MKKSIEQILQKLIAVKKPEPTALYNPAPIDEQKGGFQPAGEPWEWDSSNPGQYCKTCQSTNPPQFCSCIKALHGGVFHIIPEDVNNPNFYWNYDPNFVPPPGWKRAMEWPAGCPSLGQMMGPAFTNQAEWEAVRTSWITRIADALVAGFAGDYSLDRPARLFYDLCVPTHTQLDNTGQGWRDTCFSWVQSAINQCVINRRAGLPCTGQLFDQWWSTDWQGLPNFMYYAKFLMDNGCIGQVQSGSCCTFSEFGGATCAVVASASDCKGVFKAGGNCSGENPCGGLMPNPIQKNEEVKKQKQVMDMVISILKVR